MKPTDKKYYTASCISCIENHLLRVMLILLWRQLISVQVTERSQIDRDSSRDIDPR